MPATTPQEKGQSRSKTTTPSYLGLASVTFLAALAAAPGARADVAMPAGSLIMPLQSTLQDGCGTVSAYGLVFKTLLANDWLEKQGQTRITIHWVFNPNKSTSSHVVPTNSLQPPSYPGQTSPAWNDSRWNDGIDFVVQNTAGVPVTQIVNTSGTDPTSDKTLTTFNTTASGTFPYTLSGIGPYLAYPNYPSTSVTYAAGNPPCNAPTLTSGCNVTTVQYGGGAFIINASDAPNFTALLQGKLLATDSTGKTIDFGPFRTQTSCNMDLNLSGAGNVAQFVGGGANEHYVWIHRAKTSFSIPNDVKINAPPPRIGLLQTIDGSTGGGVVGDMLPAYLNSAGLNFTGAAGCYPGSYDAVNAKANCPQLTQGQIYDILDVHDFESGFIRNLDSTGKPIYQVLWTPHWEGTPLGACTQTCIDKALTNLSTFLDNVNSSGATNTGTLPGLMAECASVGVYDGVTAGAPYWWNYNTVPADKSQLATCVEEVAGSKVCGTKTSAVGLDQGNAPYGMPFRNCADPDSTTGSTCVGFDPGTAGAGDQFAQIGDFFWVSETGLLTNYSASSAGGNVYKPGFKPLAYGVNSLPTGGTPATRASATMDNFSYIRKDADPTKGQIIYLGGHTYQYDVSGTRVVLNTILSLGQLRTGTEAGYSGPTLYNNPTSTVAYIATYDRITTPGAPETRAFTANLGSSFIFPYHEGFLRGHDVAGGTNLANGDNQFTAALDGDSFAANTTGRGPGARNIFTYLGGNVVANPALGAGRAAPNGVVQTGWQPVDIDASSVSYSAAKCSGLDSAHIGRIAANPSLNKPGPYAGMPSGANNVCDLQEALALTITSADLKLDQGAAEQAAITSKLQQPAEILKAQELLQMVRGYCYSTAPVSGSGLGVDGSGANIPHPTDTQCNKFGSLRGVYPTQQRNGQPNKAFIGGFVHSKPVMVAASPLIVDAPAKKHRPTVAYVGGLDGMLHAFYIPSDGGDSGYTGPADSTLGWLNPAASSAFVGHTVFPAAGFTPPAALTELWAFIPPGQLSRLQDNSAEVDATTSVIDVFGDFDGSGTRKWHTVLVGSTGGSNRELFALDVTNPLNPVILWDIASTQVNILPYATQLLTDDDTGLNTANQAQSFRWQNACRTGDSTCTPASFLLPPSTDAGRSITGLYNYVHLGAGLKVSTGFLRRNNAPVFAAFVSTNEPGGNGLYVFAIDMVTGQKIWEFNHPYDTSSTASALAGMRAGLGNTPPGGVALWSTTNTTQIDRIYVGGDDGYLFELDAADGVNLTAYNAALGLAAPAATYSLSSAFASGANWAQPISTQPTIFQVTFPLPGTSALQAYQGRPMLTYGTAGTDTVASIKTPSGALVNGAVHLLPLDFTGRYQPSDLKGNSSLQSQVSTNGVAKEATGFPVIMTGGERLYGRIVVASQGSSGLSLNLPNVLPSSGAIGDQLFFATTTGTVTDIDQRGSLGGTTQDINLKAAIAGSMSQVAAAGGAGGEVGLAVDQAGNVTKIITVTDRTINVAPASSSLKMIPTGMNGSGKPPTSLVGWFFRSTGPRGYGY
jgi:type IV pilus assembly protein PilY1